MIWKSEILMTHVRDKYPDVQEITKEILLKDHSVEQFATRSRLSFYLYSLQVYIYTFSVKFLVRFYKKSCLFLDCIKTICSWNEHNNTRNINKNWWIIPRYDNSRKSFKWIYWNVKNWSGDFIFLVIKSCHRYLKCIDCV